MPIWIICFINAATTEIASLSSLVAAAFKVSIVEQISPILGFFKLSSYSTWQVIGIGKTPLDLQVIVLVSILEVPITRPIIGSCPNVAKR